MSEAPKKKYTLPSQRIMHVIDENRQAGNPMSAVDISLMTSFAILDKLDELTLIMRAFLPKANAPENKK